ncbi:MAG: GGDEF domain-containing protein [Rhodanobacteraceae bacterium]
MWRDLTAGLETGNHEQETLRKLHALEQDNLNLRQQLEQLTRCEARARYLANHDGLTGLCNRSLLMDRFVQAAAHADRCGRPMALMILDLDGFKAINDQHGHLVGDHLLQCVASHLREIARAGDTACRFGGDEFVMLLPDIGSLADARRVEDRIGKRIAGCLCMDDIDVTISASCGIALYPDDGDNWHDLLQAADRAMYGAKPRNRDQIPEEHTPRERRLSNRHGHWPVLNSDGAAPDAAVEKSTSLSN